MFFESVSHCSQVSDSTWSGHSTGGMEGCTSTPTKTSDHDAGEAYSGLQTPPPTALKTRGGVRAAVDYTVDVDTVTESTVAGDVVPGSIAMQEDASESATANNAKPISEADESTGQRVVALPIRQKIKLVGYHALPKQKKEYYQSRMRLLRGHWMARFHTWAQSYPRMSFVEFFVMWFEKDLDVPALRNWFLKHVCKPHERRQVENLRNERKAHRADVRRQLVLRAEARRRMKPAAQNELKNGMVVEDNTAGSIDTTDGSDKTNNDIEMEDAAANGGLLPDGDDDDGTEDDAQHDRIVPVYDVGEITEEDVRSSILVEEEFDQYAQYLKDLIKNAEPGNYDWVYEYYRKQPGEDPVFDPEFEAWSLKLEAERIDGWNKRGGLRDDGYAERSKFLADEEVTLPARPDANEVWVRNRTGGIDIIELLADDHFNPADWPDNYSG